MALLTDERGSVLVEYALVLALLSLAFMSGMKAIDGAVSMRMNNVQSELTNYGLRNNS